LLDQSRTDNDTVGMFTQILDLCCLAYAETGADRVIDLRLDTVQNAGTLVDDKATASLTLTRKEHNNPPQTAKLGSLPSSLFPS